MAQSLQSAVTLILSKKRYFGTAWRIDGTQLLVTTRGEIPPGSHAQLEWELDGDDPLSFETVRADVVVQQARRGGDTLQGSRRYAVELRAMAHADQHRLGRWLEGRRTAADIDPELPTDVVLGGVNSLVDEPVTERLVRPPELPRHAPRVRPATVATARTTTRKVRLTRATVRVTPGRLHLSWASWTDLEADWVSTLSRGSLYLRDVTAQPGDAFAIVAALPDGRRALLSGRVSARVRGVVFIEVSMGDQTRVLLARRLRANPTAEPSRPEAR